jgi:HPt (histidine-containing phosphotransfer) domain-containing protein
MVAITANAMQEEAERCTSAGLDACLVKPVSVAQLAAVLERLLPREPVRAPATFDRSVLREIVGDDDQAITEILGTFADAVRADAAEVYAAVAGEQSAQAGRPAHKIVGASRSVGASRMASLARVIEIASASGQARDLGSAAAAVVAEAEVIRHEVARLGAVRG